MCRSETQYLLLRNAVSMVLNGQIDEYRKYRFLSAELKDAENEDLCLDCMKGMYFCRLLKNHEGSHQELGLSWDDPPTEWKNENS